MKMCIATPINLNSIIKALDPNRTVEAMMKDPETMVCINNDKNMHHISKKLSI